MYKAVKEFNSISKGNVVIDDEFKDVPKQWIESGLVIEVKESKPAKNRKTKELKTDKKTK